MSAWMPLAVSLAASLLLTPMARSVAIRRGVVDRPDGRRKLHKAPVPLWGGVAVYLSLVVGLAGALLLGGPAADRLADIARVLIPSAGFVCLLGCVDDSWDLNPRFKLLLQVCAVLPVVVAGYYVDRVALFGYPLDLGWLGAPLTVCWLVGCINSLNLLDGLDGLASLVGLLTAVMIAIIAAISGHPHVAIISLALAGALVGFLAYNLPPASIYLGDSGSMVIGLVVGTLAMQGAMKTSATLSIAVPAAIMIVPMLDTGLAIVRRKLSGRPIDSADRGHIHHRLLDRGLNSWQVLCVVGALCLVTGAAATAGTLFRHDSVAWITALTLIVFLVRKRWFGHHELALFKLSVAAGLVRLGRFLIASTRSSDLGAPDCQSADFDDAWDDLLRLAGTQAATRIAVRLTRCDLPVEARTWSHPENSDTGSRWRLTVGHDSPEGLSCEVHVEGPQEPAGQSDSLARLARLLEPFCRRWAGMGPVHLSMSVRLPADPNPAVSPQIPPRRDAA